MDKTDFVKIIIDNNNDITARWATALDLDHAAGTCYTSAEMLRELAQPFYGARSFILAEDEAEINDIILGLEDGEALAHATRHSERPLTQERCEEIYDALNELV